MQIGQYASLPCHPDRSNPIFSSHLTSCEMVGLRSGGTSLLFSSRSPKTAVTNPSNHLKIPPVFYHVYIMASQSGVLCIGMTNTLLHSVFQHKSKTIPAFPT